MTVTEETQDLKELAQVDPDSILDSLNETIARRMPSYRDLYLSVGATELASIGPRFHSGPRTTGWLSTNITRNACCGRSRRSTSPSSVWPQL